MCFGLGFGNGGHGLGRWVCFGLGLGLGKLFVYLIAQKLKV